MDDEFAQLMIESPTYAVVSAGIEAVVCLVVLAACARYARGRAAVLGAVGALVAGVACWLLFLDTLRINGGRQPWLPLDAYELVAYARAGGFGLIGLALVLALARRGTPAER